MLVYQDAIKVLCENFPELKDIYDKESDFYIDLPYVFYETEFTKYIMESIQKQNIKNLEKALHFVEKVLQEGDNEFSNMVEVAVLEALFFEGVFDGKGQCWNLLGKLSKESVEKCKG